MISIRDILAQTVSSSLLGSDVVLSLPGGDVPTRGTWVTLESDADLLGGEGIGKESVLRIPSYGIGRPAKGVRVVVDGESWKVDEAHERGKTWLLELKKVAVKP